MRISTKSRYAIRALLDIAVNYVGEPVQIKEIAKRQGISERYLENILTLLRAAGILLSEKGKGGGFTLAKEPSEINMFDVIQIVEGKISIVKCVTTPSTCVHSPKCVARDVWTKLSNGMKRTLSSITLQDLIVKYRKKMKKSDKMMYYI